MLKVCVILSLLVGKVLFAYDVGLVITATGKYIQFVEPLVESAEKYFCKEHKRTYFVFTDGKDEKLLERDNVVLIYQSRLGWPYDTMMRFKMYDKNATVFKGQDYLFACDADMLFADYIGDEILGERVAVMHPGFYNKDRKQFSYESKPSSLASIKKNEGQYYFAGGFYGGSTEEFLKIANVNSQNIKKDLENNIIAVWHDESHWNRYCIDHPPTIILSPSYCYPESWKLPFKSRLLALDKNHDEIRK